MAYIHIKYTFLALEVDNWRKEILLKGLSSAVKQIFQRIQVFLCFQLAGLQISSWLDGVWSKRACKAADVQLRAGVTESLVDKSFSGIF